MELVMLLAADYAAVDASGKLNILGAFTTINAFQFPAKHQLMHLVVKLQPGPEDYRQAHRLRIKLFDDDGGELLQLANDFQVPSFRLGQQPEFTAVLAFRDLEFPRSGTYEFRVEVNGEPMKALPIQLVKLEQALE